MKNTLKFLSIGLVVALVLVSQFTRQDRTVEAADVKENQVEWMATSSATVITYYSPNFFDGDSTGPGNRRTSDTGTTSATFFIRDADLGTTPTATTTWTDTSCGVSGCTYDLFTGNFTGDGERGIEASATSTVAVAVASKATGEPTQDSYMHKYLGNASTTVVSLEVISTTTSTGVLNAVASDSGIFTVHQTVATGSDLQATYTYHIIDEYSSSTRASGVARAHVTSTSDSTGTWVPIIETVANGNSSELDDQSTVFAGTVVLSEDASAAASTAANSNGNWDVWVQDGDTVTVTYYASDQTTVIDSTTITVDAKAPEVTVTSDFSSVIKDKSPTITFTVTDAGAGFTSTDPHGHIDVTINDDGDATPCIVLDSEFNLGSLSGSSMTLTVDTGLTDWDDASTGTCDGISGRTAGGFDLDITSATSTDDYTYDGADATYIITVKDKVGNSFSTTAANGSFHIDGTAPALSSAQAGKIWDADDSKDVTDVSTVKLTFDESLDQATVTASDFTVDGITPASVSFGGKAVTGAGTKDTFVYLTMTSALAPDVRPVVKLIGSVSDRAGNELKEASTSTTGYAAKVTGTDGLTPTLSNAVVAAHLLANSGTAAISYDSNENMTDNSNTIANGCTCVVVQGGSSDTTTASSTKIAVTLTTVTSGTATFKEASFNVDGIYGVIMAGRDVNGNTGSLGYTAVSKENVSDHITADVAAGGDVTVKLDNWPIVDHDGDGAMTDGFTVTVNGTATTSHSVATIGWGEDEDIVLNFSSDIKSTDVVKLSYYYAAADYTVEIDTSKPAVSAFTPSDGSSTTNRTPFISVAWDEDEYAHDSYTTVTITKATLTDPDGVVTDISGDLNTTDSKDFFYRPTSDLALGDYTFTVSAKDSAGNEQKDQTARFTVKAKAATSVDLLPGWNLISLPGTPADTAINSVVTITSVQTILTYDPTVPGGWLTAVRDGDSLVGTLATMDASHAYWVNTTNDDPIKVDIPGYGGGAQQLPPAIGLVKGWNLVPAVTITGATSTDSDAYFAGLDWTRAYGYDTATDAYSSFAPSTATGDAKLSDDLNVVMEKGYWVYLNAAGTLIP